MGRGKLNMELISNEKSRMITYQKRKKGLTKKVQEFHVLCDVDACIVVFGPKFNNRPVDIETWPADPCEVSRIISRYRNQGSDRKRNQDLSHFFIARKKKVDDEIAKIRKARLEAKYPTWDNRLNLLQPPELSVLASVLESKIEAATAKIFKMGGEYCNNYFMQMLDSSSMPENINNNIQGSGGLITNTTIRPNTMATTFANALIQKSLEFEAFKPKPFSLMSQMDHQTFSNHQMLPIIDVNPLNSSLLMMMAMSDGEDLSQFGSESSCSKRASNVVKEPAGYFEPPPSHQQMVFNNNDINHRAHPVTYYGLNRQLPMLPYRQDSSVLHHLPNASSHPLRFPQFPDFCDVNEFERDK